MAMAAAGVGWGRRKGGRRGRAKVRRSFLAAGHTRRWARVALARLEEEGWAVVGYSGPCGTGRGQVVALVGTQLGAPRVGA